MEHVAVVPSLPPPSFLESFLFFTMDQKGAVAFVHDIVRERSASGWGDAQINVHLSEEEVEKRDAALFLKVHAVCMPFPINVSVHFYSNGRRWPYWEYKNNFKFTDGRCRREKRRRLLNLSVELLTLGAVGWTHRAALPWKFEEDLLFATTYHDAARFVTHA